MTVAEMPLVRPSVTPLPPSRTATVVSVDRRVVLHGVSWETYCRLSDEAGTGAIRMTFDRGRLEIMSVSALHEHVKTITARIIESYALFADATVEGFGNMTIRREDLDRGLEPDECYYIAKAAAVFGRSRLDFAVDPPPDLAIEVDVSPPEIDRPSIYAALGVPEIWRYIDGRLVYTARSADGSYQPTERSVGLPGLPNEWVNDLIEIGLTQSQTAAVAELRRRMTA